MEIHEHRSLLLGGFYWKDSPRILRDILCLSMSAAEPLVIGPRHWPQTWRRAPDLTAIPECRAILEESGFTNKNMDAMPKQKSNNHMDKQDKGTRSRKNKK